MFILIQSLAILAVSLFLMSYHTKTRSLLLAFQFIGLLIWGVHFAFLSAWTGMWLFAANEISIILFIFREKYDWINKKILLLILLAMLFLTIMTWEIFSPFAFLGVAFMVLARYQINPKKIRWLAILSSLSWIVYDYFVLSYGGIVAETLIIVSIVASLFKQQRRNS